MFRTLIPCRCLKGCESDRRAFNSRNENDLLELDLLGHKFACSLYVFDFTSFGIILGMNWLEKYGVRIFCQDREIF
jgi:hypothetical protein